MAAKFTNAQLAARLLKAENELKNANLQLRILGRKSRGTTSAHERSFRLEGELAMLRKQLSEQGPNPVLIGQIASFEEAVTGLTSRVEILEEGQADLSQRLETGLRAVNGTLDEHTATLAQHDTELGVLRGRITHFGEQFEAFVVSTVKSVNDRFNLFVAIPVGILAFIGGILWVNADFKADVVARGRVIGYAYGAANQDWAFWLYVLFGVLLTLAAGWLFALRGKTTDTTQVTTTTKTTTAKVTPAESDQDTAVMPKVEAEPAPSASLWDRWFKPSQKPEPAPTPAKV